MRQVWEGMELLWTSARASLIPPSVRTRRTRAEPLRLERFYADDTNGWIACGTITFIPALVLRRRDFAA